MLAGLLFVAVNVEGAGVVITKNTLVQLLRSLAVAIGAFLINQAIVILVWVEGSDMTTIDNPAPNESGVLTHPLDAGWKVLLLFTLLLDLSILVYLLTKRQYWLRLAFCLGIAVPLIFLVGLFIG